MSEIFETPLDIPDVRITQTQRNARAMIRPYNQPVELMMHPGAAVGVSARLVRVLAWVLSNLDGRLCHASILENARAGRIGLRLPEIGLSGWVHGIEMEAGLLVFDIYGVDIRFPIPSEEILLQRSSGSGQPRRFATYAPPPKSPWNRNADSTEKHVWE